MSYPRPFDKQPVEVAFSIVAGVSVQVVLDFGDVTKRYEVWDVRTTVTTLVTATKISTRLGVVSGFAANDKSQRYANIDNTLTAPGSYANSQGTLRQEIQSDATGQIYCLITLDATGNASGFVRVVLAPGG